MSYRYIRKYTSPNYTPGRPYGIKSITIHYWDDPKKKPRFIPVVNYLCRPHGSSSAHYVAEAGRVACIVDPDNRAWHAGDGFRRRHNGNNTSIGIECNPRRSQGDLETVAELVADLRRTYGNLPLFPHNHWHSTSCPGNWEEKLAWLDKRANEILQGKKRPTQTKNPPPPRKEQPEMNAEETRILHEINDRTKRLENEVFGMNPLDDTNALGLANFCRRLWRAVRPPAGTDSTQPAGAAWNTFQPWREAMRSSDDESK